MSPVLRVLFGGVVLAALLLCEMVAQCEPQWGTGDPASSPQGSINAVVNWDPDGAGPASVVLVAVGQFSVADRQSTSVATWDGAVWAPLGVSPMFRATAAAVYNGELIVAGDGKVVRWTGATWQQIAVYTSAINSSAINTMAVFGGELYVGGHFATIGGATVGNIARWNGSSWNPLGSGAYSIPSISDHVYAMAAYTYGGVAGLYVGGSFTYAGGQVSTGLAFWNGSTWSPFGVAGTVRSLAVRSSVSPSTSHLFIGGTFTAVAGVPADKVARYNSSAASVTPLTGFPGSSECRTLFVRGIGSSSYELVGGEASQLWRWTGTTWNTLAPSLSAVEADTLATYGGQPTIVTSGYYGGRYVVGTSQGDGLYGGVFDHDGVTWRRVNGAGIDDRVYAVLPVGGQFLIGGSFRSISGVTMNGVAIGTPGNWQPMAGGLTGGGSGIVLALAKLPNGDLVAGGSFALSNGGALDRIARWDGSTWSPLAGGMNQTVRALTVLDDGALIAGGDFWLAGSTAASSVARWNDTYWSDLANGLNSQVHSLAPLPGGGLVAGGFFSGAVGGGPVLARVARWNGTSWLPMGSGFDGVVRGLAVHRDGDVLACGDFENAGATVTDNIARWDGTAWQAMPPGLSSARPMHAIVALPDGGVVVAGRGAQAPLVPGSYDLAVRLRDGAWSGMRVGHWSISSTPDLVCALAMAPSGEVVVGGEFHRVGNVVNGNFATLSPSCPANAVAYGSGCAGSNGLDLLTATSLPWIGASYRAHGEGLPPLGFCASVFGFTSVSLPLQPLLPQALPGCTLLAAPDLFDLQLTTGALDVATPIPATLAIVGLPLHHQLVTIELGPAGQFVAVTSSNGLALTIGAL